MEFIPPFSIGYKYISRYLIYTDKNNQNFHLKCPYCGSSKIVWANWYEIKELDLEERLKCEQCKKEFFLKEMKLGKKLK